MLRIFGFYKFNSESDELINQMESIFKINCTFNEYINFDQENISLIFEAYNTTDAKNFYSIEHNNKIACFVVGNIFAYENSSLKILTGQHLANFIIQSYKTNKFDFVKHLRGTFNIIIVDKQQLFLINDKLGLSPMYVYHTDDGFLFSNEPELIMWLNIRNRVNYHSISQFLIYGFVPDGKTFIRGINNQAPGTISKISKNIIKTKKYYDFQPIKLSNTSVKNTLLQVKDIFLESVQIRTSENDSHAHVDLSGGWDTRLITKNLIDLNKRITAFTQIAVNEDSKISKMIAKKWNINHIFFNQILNNNPRLFLDLTYRKRRIANYIQENSLQQTEYFKILNNSNFFTKPRFTGLFGTQILGTVQTWFRERIKLNIETQGKKYFSREFSEISLEGDKDLPSFHFSENHTNPVHLYSNQVCRSYLACAWDRPMSKFTHNNLVPFTDLKLIQLLSSIDYDKYMPYKLYEMLLKIHHPSCLELPWTFRRIRKNNPLKTLSKIQNDEEINTIVYKNSRFISFLRQGTFINKYEFASKRLKEIYFLFNWLEVFKSILDPSDVNFCIKENNE